MERKSVETSPKPEYKQKEETEDYTRNVFEYNALQNDIDPYYATSHSKETPKADKTSYKGHDIMSSHQQLRSHISKVE